MEPDVVEIPPPPPSIASGSRTRSRKPRKAVIPEVIDVENYEFRNGGDVLNNNSNVFENKNKGKAIQVESFSFNKVQSHHHGSSLLNLEAFQDCYDHNDPFTQLANQFMDVDDYSMFQDILDPKPVPAGAEMMVPWGLNLSKGTAKASRSSLSNQATNANGNPYLETTHVPQPWDFFPGSGLSQDNQSIYPSASFSMVQPQAPDIVMMPAPISNAFRYDTSASSSRPIAADVISSAQDSSNVRKIKQEFLRNFKRFDTVEDIQDHHYASKGKGGKQYSKNWVKKVQSDWNILENDLPEMIFVRACESRMDILRAVIIGAEGTPYHDGLFFFDIQFPDNYPSVPPKVHYHAGGLRINPNLYNCGKVCLSLLGTWSGTSREKWLPKESTMLQLLVSIQALILNQKPYFNEPGYEQSKGTASGESHSKAYSEDVFLLSLKTMVYNMRRPPMHFEEFVRSHFFVQSHDIVKACNAYKDGAPLGSMVKGGVQDVEESSQSGSKKFRTDVVSFMKTAVDEFVKLGVKELEEKPKSNVNSEDQSSKTNRKRSRSPSIKDFLANIGRCVFQT